jgi:hypothetical protein
VSFKAIFSFLATASSATLIRVAIYSSSYVKELSILRCFLAKDSVIYITSKSSLQKNQNVVA